MGDTPVALPSLQKAILRVVQTADGGSIERSDLGKVTRSYNQDHWDEVLQDLVDRGLITETSTIRVGEKSRSGQKRAVIIYHMTRFDQPQSFDFDPDVVDGRFGWPKFTEMEPEAVANFVAKFPKQ
jgi:hypothetical protein